MNNGLALRVLLLGGPLFVECYSPWALSITNQSKLSEIYPWTFTFGYAFGGVHYEKHEQLLHMVSLG